MKNESVLFVFGICSNALFCVAACIREMMMMMGSLSVRQHFVSCKVN